MLDGVKLNFPRDIEGQGGDMILYKTKDGRVALDVRLKRETLWLSQKQMSALFDKNTDTIGLHIRNTFKEGELEKPATTEECSVVQNEGGRSVRRSVRFYNLDVIISVGYRVKSQRGTQFRIWATQVLKDHILKGYSLNESRLQKQTARLLELQAAVDLIGRMLTEKPLTGMEAEGLLEVITDYSLALTLLDQYDHRNCACTAPLKQAVLS
jgi:hypothetical protein